MTTSHHTTREAFATMRRELKARHRDIAQKLNISEGELIAAHVGASAADSSSDLQAIALRKEWAAIVESLEPLGEVMALTRNDACVHEKDGVYSKASHHGSMGLVLGGEIDLRIFYQQWAHGFAVSEQTDKGLQRSLQFYDATGAAVHKIFLRPQSDVMAYEAVVEKFTDAAQVTGFTPAAAPTKPLERADTEIDILEFHQAWASLRDTHDFFGLLKKFGVTRTQALRLAEPRFVQQLDVGSCRRMLEAAAHERVAIMVFVGNPGMIQIHSGPIKKFAAMEPWINVLDAGFNLHLREDQIATTWIVKKPTVDGLVTSVEMFDAAGETIAMIFGERKPGIPELCEWRVLVEKLLQESELCAA